MSDVHGNLPALRAVAEALPAHDQVVVAGDLCLEGPCPAQVFDFLMETGWSLVMGNTDEDILSPAEDLGKKKTELVRWTREQLGKERLQRLSDLPFSQTLTADGGAQVLVVHANPLNLDDHLYPTMSEEDLRPYLEDVEAGVLAFGHLHVPYVRPVGAVLLVDVSSVGQPKDRDLRAAFTVLRWDGDTRSITQVRIPYDVEETIDLMRRSGMPYAEEEANSLLKASY